MSGSSILVAVNALAVKRLPLPIRAPIADALRAEADFEAVDEKREVAGPPTRLAGQARLV